MNLPMPAAMPPAPTPGSAGDFYWRGAAERKLMIQRCQRCGTYVHLPRPVCRRCGSFDLLPEQVSGDGVLYTFTKTYKAFHPYYVDRVPYLIAVVELVEQARLRVLGNLVADDDEVHIGMDVRVDFEVRPSVTVPIFRPLGASA